MTETYYAGAYWMARPEPAEECARRAALFFQLLGHCDPAWSHWYEAGNSFEQARTLPFTPGTANFLKLFGQKENRLNDAFRYWLWAGDSPEQKAIADGFCGSADALPTSFCTLTPPAEGDVAERVLTVPVMRGILRAMALAWDPEWGVATSHTHRDKVVTRRAAAGSFVGWVMYFSRQRGVVPLLPAPVSVEPVEDKGTLVILTPERFTASSAEHAALATRVHDLLGRAGLLHPLLPR
jgi:Immunity protein 52